MTTPSLRIVSPDPTWHGDALTELSATAVGAAERQRRPLGRLLFASDVFAVVTACMVAGLVLAAVPSLAPTAGTGPDRLAFVLVSAVLTIVVLATRGAYTKARRQLAPGVADELPSLVSGVAVSGLVLLAAGAAGPLAGRMPPVGVAVVVGASLLLIPTYRSATLALVAHDQTRITRVIVVGSGRVAGELAQRLDRSPLVEVVGTVDDDPAGSLDVLGAVDDLPKLCRTVGADRVIIAFSRRHPARSAELVLALRDVVEVDVVVRYFELAGWESRLHDVAGLSLLNLGGHPGRLSVATKRLFDVAVAVTGLVVLAPVMALVALAVWSESGGPILFRQTRVGRHRRPFRILKFRTMTQRRAPVRAVRAPKTLFAAPDPELVTGVGRLLRRTGLDELPQLLNVLRGEMSLVGPRPFVPEECNALGGWALRRFDARPGMTGMWQVCGQHEVSFDELCRLDVQYATSWSIRTDVRILARTPSRLLHGSSSER